MLYRSGQLIRAVDKFILIGQYTGVAKVYSMTLGVALNLGQKTPQIRYKFNVVLNGR